MDSFIYLQNWHSGEVICREVDRTGDFEIKPEVGLASKNLSYINNFWRILPDLAPVGPLPEEERAEFMDFFIRFYRDRTIYCSVTELLTAVQKFQVREDLILSN